MFHVSILKLFLLPHGTSIIVIPLGNKAFTMDVSCVYFLFIFICYMERISNQLLACLLFALIMFLGVNIFIIFVFHIESVPKTVNLDSKSLSWLVTNRYTDECISEIKKLPAKRLFGVPSCV